ncbi:hypothetical protein HY448_01255 [Candidatus Pacearchaeota archaeon]|nr:hypothetical protein [Candidatus Pacearchaeota archaeon]
MFENKKHVFWQAFFLTVLFFSLGLVLGVYFEQTRNDNTNMIFYQSETSLYDSFALGILSSNPTISCEGIELANIDFANSIYEEALSLEEFDESNKMTKSLKSIHRKYDLLRTLLWMNMISVKEKCKDISTVVYLYEYNTDDIETRSKQIVWSRILQDLKEQKGDEIILIPIAVDQGIISLEHLIKPYGISKFPVVVVNEKTVLYEHQSVKELAELLA